MDDAQTKETVETIESRHWYGWQTLATDGATLALTLTAAGLDGHDNAQRPFIVLATGSYLLGGPVVHGLHNHMEKAVLSLALRVALPLTFAGVTAAALKCTPGENDDDSMCGLGTLMGAITAGVLGMAAASAIDAAAIARETVAAAPSVLPAVQIGRNSGWVGMTGRF